MRLVETLFKDYDHKNQLMNHKAAKLISTVVAVIFLMIHASLFVLFALTGVRPMMIFNSFSILFYVAEIWLIRNKGQFRLFVFTTYIEVILHMSAAVYFVGWNCGFQITLIGINLMLFFAEYCAGILRIETLPSLQMSFLTMTVYLLDYIISSAFPAPYHLAYQVEFSLQIIWAIITFVITITCMQSFLWLTFSTETLLSKRAASDRLTGLNNRFFLSEYLHREEKESGLDGHWAAMMDIDDFKSINDTYGHLFGDHVLKTMADILNEYNIDAEISRWGGEEFLITGRTDGDMKIHLARLERLRSAVEEYEFKYNGTAIRVTITIGVAVYQQGQTLEEWIDCADKKLYEGKRSGKNRIVA